MRSKDILKDALLRFDGTLIIVSHDRDFLAGLTQKVIEFRNKAVKEYIGDISEFLEARKIEHLNELEKKKASTCGANNSEIPSQNKMDYARRKQAEREQRKVKSRIEKSEATISEIEKMIATIDRILANPNPGDKRILSGEIYKEYESIKQKLAGEMEHWEQLHTELEEMERN